MGAKEGSREEENAGKGCQVDLGRAPSINVAFTLGTTNTNAIPVVEATHIMDFSMVFETPAKQTSDKIFSRHIHSLKMKSYIQAKTKKERKKLF